MQPSKTTSIIENCRYCLMCRHVCPVGHVTSKETLTPHGWGITIASVKRSLAAWNPETVDVLYSCADCGTCRAHCVTDQALPDAIAATRAEVVAANLAPVSIHQLQKDLKEWSNPYQKKTPEPAKGKSEFALFVGDDARYLVPAVLDGALSLLKAVGISPVLVGVGRNNGYLASSLGFPEIAKDLIQVTQKEVKASGAKCLLVLTPGDQYAFSSMSSERLGLEWLQGIEIQEVTTLLDAKLTSGALKLRSIKKNSPYAYLDPTHSLRIPSRHEAPRRLLAKIMPGQGLELFWRKERAHPTGNGALQFTNPHISRHLTYARLEDAKNAGAQLLLTEDPGCLYHLASHADLFGVKIMNLYEVLAENLAK
jgi:Fe-S oxidoreductase